MNAPAEVKSVERMVGIDLARCIAIIGMMIINFNETIARSYEGSGLLLHFVRFIPGRAAVTFVMLAGIGMSFMGRRARLSGDSLLRRKVRTSLLKRAGLLFLIGMIFVISWEGDILHFYGVFIFTGALMLFWPARWLWACTVLLNIGFVAMLMTFSYGVGFDWENDLNLVNFWTIKGYARNLVFDGWFPIFPWFGFLLMGIWAGRLDLRSHSVLLRLGLGGGLVFIVAEVASRVLSGYLESTFPGMRHIVIQGLVGRGCLPPGPLFFLSTAGGSLLLITLCLFIAEKYRKARWMEPLVATGQFAFTIYLAHVYLVIIPLLYLGWEDVPISQSVATALTACAIFMVFSTLWKKRFGRGPLEWVMRRVANGNPTAS
ncbi:MAG: DUF418 domain-containing protein [Pontiellaceae bacterium]|nr:DUF418 domain-containing protein [Pontiellaceae bacterium]MBN2785668.1 DUF418 domain-containing protein [Pontiellaceae bacterium]